MALNPKILRQTAIYWALSQVNEYGDLTHAAPVEIKCRWDTMRSTKFDDEGNPVTYDSQVFVDRDIDVNGYLMLGELTDLGGDTLPPPADARRVKRYEKFGNFRQSETFRICML